MMKLFIFNQEFDKDETITQSSTYVVAADYEGAIRAYRNGEPNNECIWSVKGLGNPVIVDG
jgi:hypothetical protein